MVLSNDLAALIIVSLVISLNWCQAHVSSLSPTSSRFADPDQLELFFTIRNFMPITCASQVEIQQFWGGSPWPVSKANGCPLANERKARTVIPHPDFQIGFEIWKNNSSPLGSFYWAPGGGTPGLLNPLQSTPMMGMSSRRPTEVSLNQTITPLVEPYLEFDPATGLGKPVYCKRPRCGVPYHYIDPTWPNVNPAWTEFPNLASLAGEGTFRVWFRDDSRYNRRVGIRMRLERVTNASAAEAGATFVFDSANEPNKRFHPLDRFLISDPDAVFPLTQNQEAISEGGNSNGGGGHKYWFTSECHTFFEYRKGSKIFSFQGDDDFLAYINNRLVVDLSGMHEPYQSSIDLDAIASHLGLVPGRVYPLDIFHAERRIVDSNFKMTTNLVSGCNVLRAGETVFNTSEATISGTWRDQLKLVGSSVQSSTNELLMTPLGAVGVVGYAFHQTGQNTVQGMILEFAFTVLSAPAKGVFHSEGFSVVLHRDPNGISDMNGGSGGNLGMRNFRNTVAVAVDLCADRSTPDHDRLPVEQQCRSREVRVHVAANGSAASVKNFRLRESVSFRNKQLDQGRPHLLRLVYYGLKPNWLEVYFDNSLFMVLRDFDVQRDLGGKDTWVGITSSTGPVLSRSATIAVTNWTMQTVGIDSSFTTAEPLMPLDEDENGRYMELIADGKRSVGMRITVNDACSTSVSYGGYGDWGRGWMVPYESNRSLVERRLEGEEEMEDFSTGDNSTSSPPQVIEAIVVDNQNGTYDVVFQSNLTGIYSLIVMFGPDCPRNLSKALVGEEIGPKCWNQTLDRFIVSIEPPPAPPVIDDSKTFPWHVVIAVGSGLGGMIMCCCLMVLLLLGARRRWRNEKQFVPAGQLAVLDRDVELDGNPMGLMITAYAQKLQRTNTEMLKLRAADPERKDEVIAEMRKSTKDLQARVQSLKRKLQEDEHLAITRSHPNALPSPRRRPRYEPGRSSVPHEFDIDTDFSKETSSMAVYVWTRHPEASFVVSVSQRDIDMIEGFIDDYPDSIVGGDLFGCFPTRQSNDCQVVHATGPAVGATFGRAFTQDEGFTQRALDYLSHHEPSLSGTLMLGRWISFHRLQSPLQSELDRAWAEAKSRDRFLLFAVHIRSENLKTGQKQVIISPVLFENDTTAHKFGELRVLDDDADEAARLRHIELERMRKETGDVPSAMRINKRAWPGQMV